MSAWRGSLTHEGEPLVEDGAEHHLAEGEVHPPRLDLGQVEHVVDEGEQVAARLDDVDHVARLPIVEVTGQAPVEDLGEADDGVQRSAQLVRHPSQELALVPGHLGQLHRHPIRLGAGVALREPQRPRLLEHETHDPAEHARHDHDRHPRRERSGLVGHCREHDREGAADQGQIGHGDATGPEGEGQGHERHEHVGRVRVEGPGAVDADARDRDEPHPEDVDRGERDPVRDGEHHEADRHRERRPPRGHARVEPGIVDHQRAESAGHREPQAEPRAEPGDEGDRDERVRLELRRDRRRLGPGRSSRRLGAVDGGDGEGEGRAPPWDRVDGEVAAVQLHESARQRQAEAGALLSSGRVGRLGELLEDAVLVGEGDARPCVGHRHEADPGGGEGAREGHAPAGRRELHGVRQQVEHDLHDLSLVGHHHRSLRQIEHQLDAASVASLADHRLRVGQHRREIHLTQHELHPTGLDPRQIEHVVDQREQVATGVPDVGQVFGLPLVQLAWEPTGQHLGEADDGVQRGAQLV